MKLLLNLTRNVKKRKRRAKKGRSQKKDQKKRKKKSRENDPRHQFHQRSSQEGRIPDGIPDRINAMIVGILAATKKTLVGTTRTVATTGIDAMTEIDAMIGTEIGDLLEIDTRKNESERRTNLEIDLARKNDLTKEAKNAVESGVEVNFTFSHFFTLF